MSVPSRGEAVAAGRQGLEFDARAAACDRYIGLMSGTSLDGVDAALVDFSPPDHADAAPATQSAAAGTQDSPDRWRVLAHVHLPFTEDLRSRLLALNRSGDDELHRCAMAAQELTRLYAQAVQALRDMPGADGPVRAVGVHGQTVRHRPDLGYTVQINQPALLAELTGLDVVADFRSRDIAAGGQGAPLAPAFHAARWQRPGHAMGVLNLGGIANLTVLGADGGAVGFDTGPASVLMDAWIRHCRGLPHDDGGAWAASGRVDEALLQVLLAEPYFAWPAPKSTGRDLFDLPWLQARLQAHAATGNPAPTAVDVQRTLCELTARSVAQAWQDHAAHGERLVACGGGTRNRFLIERLGALLAPVPVETSDRHGIAPDQVEAVAFAWLARQALRRLPGALAAVTGAQGARVLGAIHPGLPAAATPP